MPLMSYRAYAAHRNCSLRAVQKAVGEPDKHGQRQGRIAAALVPVAGSLHPKIDSDQADALWILNTDEAKRSTLFTPSNASTLDPAAALALVTSNRSRPPAQTAQLGDRSAPGPFAHPGHAQAKPSASDPALPLNSDLGADLAASADPDPAALESTLDDATKKSYHESRAKRAQIDAENAQIDLDERKGRLISLAEATRISFTALRALRDSLRNIAPRLAASLAASSDPFECERLLAAELDAALATVTVDTLLTDTPDEDQDLDPDAEGTPPAEAP
jgi:hypothetical protein